MRNIINKIRNFKKEDEGSIVIEAIIILPLLVTVFVSMMVFFDAFRARGINKKAAYTISDLISREKLMVGDDYVEGMHAMFDFIVGSNRPTQIRVTMFQFDTEDPDDETDGRYVLIGSHGTGDTPDLDEDELNEMADRIPILDHGRTAFLVETRSHYVPGFRKFEIVERGTNNLSSIQIIPPFDIKNMIVTTTRFTPPCWESCIGG